MARRQRRVRTPEGAKRYGVPIGSPIPTGRSARKVLDRLGEQLSLFGKDQATLTAPKPKARLDAAPTPPKRSIDKYRALIAKSEAAEAAEEARAAAVPRTVSKEETRARANRKEALGEDAVPWDELTDNERANAIDAWADVVPLPTSETFEWRPDRGDNTTYTRATRFKKGDVMHLMEGLTPAPYEVMSTRTINAWAQFELRNINTNERIKREFASNEFLDRFDKPDGAVLAPPLVVPDETNERGNGLYPGITSFSSEIKAPQAINDLPAMRELFAMDYDEKFDTLSTALNGQYGNELKIEIRDVDSDEDGPSFSFEANIRNASGDRVGRLARTISHDDDGRLKVHNDLLEIYDDEEKGKKFASNFYAATESWYRRAGVEYVDIHASLEDGAYTWAKAGFTWDPEMNGPQSWHIASIREAMESARTAMTLPIDKRRMALLIERMESSDLDKWPHPRTIAMFQDSTGKSWGRQILHYQDWYGVKPL